MIILLFCIIIFIIYVSICVLLGYYFIKARPIWDTIFSIDSVLYEYKEFLFCPEHFIIWLPWIDFEETKCVLDKKKIDDSKIQIKKVLEYVYNIMKNISNINMDNMDNIDNIKNDNKICNLEKIKWVLEGTMKDFNRMYDENTEFYNNLSNSYEILCSKVNDKVNDKVNKKINDNDNNDNHKKFCLSLEDLVVIDNNIELSENISDVLSVFSNSEYKLWNQIKSGYMKALIYDLIENVRIYRLNCIRAGF